MTTASISGKERRIMHLYPFLIFVHILGAIALFAAIAIEAISLAALDRTESSAAARTWVGLLALPFRLGPSAMAAILLSGMGMMAMGWGHPAWLVAAMIGLVAMGAVGGLVSLRGFRRLRAALASETEPKLSDAFWSAPPRTALGRSVVLRLAIGIGILALMSFKPGALGSSLVLAAAGLTGLIAGQARGATPRSMRTETSET
jgi:small-conductance mechanosensitive channel